ncbi:MAG: hypothetical protein PHT88_00680 [Candidatus Moranbacteria bacterium]|nr:hypothetical protein [Candidatus Moranbacteria bacterium]
MRSFLTTTSFLEQLAVQYCGSRERLSIKKYPVNGYPYILSGHSIHPAKRGLYDSQALQKFITKLFNKIIDAEEKDSGKVKILREASLIDDGLIANKSALQDVFQNEDAFVVEVPPLHAQFKCKRFGSDYGISVLSTNGRNEKHQKISSLLDDWLLEEDRPTGLRTLEHRYVITTQRTFSDSRSSEKFNLYDVLEGLKKYIPWICWFGGSTDVESFAANLVDQWRSEYHDTTSLGEYKEIDIRGRLLYGTEEQRKMWAWRCGSLDTEHPFDETSGVVSFRKGHSSQNDNPHIELIISAPGFSEDSWAFEGDDGARCYQHQFKMEAAAIQIITGLGLYGDKDIVRYM